RQSQDAFFGEQIVELELAQLDVEPWAVPDVVDPGHDSFEVKGSRGVGGGQRLEGNILFQRATGMEVETTQIETAGSDFLHSRWRLIRRNLTGADPVPK